MDRREEHEMLRKSGFAEVEMNRLIRLRSDHHEQKRLQTIEENRRLEFVRWLVSRGKLNEQIA